MCDLQKALKKCDKDVINDPPLHIDEGVGAIIYRWLAWLRRSYQPTCSEVCLRGGVSMVEREAGFSPV